MAMLAYLERHKNIRRELWPWLRIEIEKSNSCRYWRTLADVIDRRRVRAAGILSKAADSRPVAVMYT